MKPGQPSKTASNEPIFAFPSEDDDFYRYGMKLRDYFAGQCITGMLAAAGSAKAPMTNELMARFAYDIADAMMESRKP